METINSFSSRCIPLQQNNIDTDQIIPSRYLKAIDKASVVEGLFADWRFKPDGSENEDFVLNKSEYEVAQIILAGDNFGCGSSREHAPWAILGWGIRAVISTSFGDIFRNNSLKNGLLPIAVNEETHQTLFDMVEESPLLEIQVDLPHQTITLPGGEKVNFEINPFAKKCLLSGMDQLEYILSLEEDISRYEREHQIG